MVNTLAWAVGTLALRPDIQEKAYRSIKEADPRLLQSPNVTHTRVEYLDAFTKEGGSNS